MERPESFFPIIGLIYGIKRAKMMRRHFIGNMAFTPKKYFFTILPPSYIRSARRL